MSNLYNKKVPPDSLQVAMKRRHTHTELRDAGCDNSSRIARDGKMKRSLIAEPASVMLWSHLIHAQFPEIFSIDCCHSHLFFQ
jgi:hypothetical protein